MAKLLFIGTQDWHFARHHLPLVRAARERDHDVVVAAADHGQGARIAAAGARFVPLTPGLWRNHPVAVARCVGTLRQIMLEQAPALVQLHGIRAALAGLAAARLTAIPRRIAAVNGLGMVSASTGLPGDGMRALARMLTGAAMAGGTRLVLGSPADAAVLGLDPANPALRITGGAGVDPLIHMPEPMPWSPPLKLAFISPLLWAHGPGLAVDAVAKARAAGADVTLSLIGAPWSASRNAVPRAILEGWSSQPGIGWFAPASDMAQVWRQHHALILPAGGGDGLPAIALQAAASARPLIVSSSAGGSASFVRDGIDGRVVDGSDPDSLAEAIIQFARAPALVERMGRSARERVLNGYTERQVMDAFRRLWAEMLGPESPA
ncbi:MAG: glycosyltransferase [Hyphomicrobiales bacterium]|nr:glycosyltransferase [Hyphomicrobiales bacterium]